MKYGYGMRESLLAARRSAKRHVGTLPDTLPDTGFGAAKASHPAKAAWAASDRISLMLRSNARLVSLWVHCTPGVHQLGGPQLAALQSLTMHDVHAAPGFET